MILVEDCKADYSGGKGAMAMGIGTTTVGFSSGRESLDSTLNTDWLIEIYRQGAEWTSMDRKILRGNFKGKGDSG